MPLRRDTAQTKDLCGDRREEPRACTPHGAAGKAGGQRAELRRKKRQPVPALSAELDP